MMRGAWRYWRLIPRLFPYLRPYRGLVVVSILLSAVSVVIGLADPWPLAFMVDTVIGRKSPPGLITAVVGDQSPYTLLVLGAAGSLLLVLARNAVTVFHEYVNTKVHQFFVLNFRSGLFEHAQRLSISYHESKPTGQLLQQINYEPEQAAQLLLGVPPLAQSLITVVAMFVIALRIDPILALVSLTVVPVIYYSIGVYATRIVPRLQKVRSLEWQTSSILFESMNMIRVVAAFAREPFEFAKFRRQGQTSAGARVGLTVRQTVFSLVVNSWTGLGTALVLGIGAWHVLGGRLTVGELLVVLAYIASVYGPIETISSSISAMQQQLISVQGSLYILDAHPDVSDSPNAITLPRPFGAVAFDRVFFNYPGRTATLEDITFAVNPGQRAAIVGPTGAGKTTLVSLIKRFRDVKSGTVTVDGIDVRDLKVRSLREQVSVVLQTPELFSGTIAENIRYGRLDASMGDITEASKAANADDFIQRLPHGYETVLGEGGAQLSAGERQRICIARAFLKDAPILILDEPTSSIDSKTEAVILDALDRLAEGRTTFVIAHRLSTIRHADVIQVLDGGRLVESGTHEQLLEGHGLYRQLYDVQMGVDLVERLSRRVIALDPVTGTEDDAGGSRALIAQVQGSLAAALNGTVSHEALAHAAALLVQSVEPMLAKDSPQARRTLKALRSKNPLADRKVAAAFSDALVELHDLAVDLGLGAKEALA